MSCQLGHWHRTQVGVIVISRHIQYAANLALLRSEGNAHRMALVAIFFPVVQMLEHLVLDAVGHALAHRPRRRNQGNHPPGRFRSTAMIVRPLPEPAFPPLDRGYLAFQKRKVDLIDQRSVTEHPR